MAEKSSSELTLEQAKEKLLDITKSVSKADLLRFAQHLTIVAEEIERKLLTENISVVATGWLVKKMKKRYFVVADHILYWFTQVQEIIPDLGNKARGSIELAFCSLCIHPDKKFCLQLLSPKCSESYILKGSDDNDTTLWYERLTKAIYDARAAKEQNRKFQVPVNAFIV